jgi:hypothetical protein
MQARKRRNPGPRIPLTLHAGYGAGAFWREPAKWTPVRRSMRRCVNREHVPIFIGTCFGITRDAKVDQPTI